MGFCPMACASPMLARMTSVKGFFTPWEGGCRGSENGPYRAGRSLSYVTVGMGLTQLSRCSLEHSGGAQGHTWRSSCSSSRARSTMGPRTAYSTFRTHGFMVSSVSTFSFSPFIATWLWSPALKAMTLLRPGRKVRTRQDSEVGIREAGSRLSGPGLGRGSLGRGALGKGHPLRCSLLAPLKGTEKAEEVGAAGPRPTRLGTVLPQEAIGSA